MKNLQLTDEEITALKKLVETDQKLLKGLGCQDKALESVLGKLNTKLAPVQDSRIHFDKE
jgi:hypothetical protein